MHRILAAIRMGIAMQGTVAFTADDPALESGLRGIAEGAAGAVISTCGLKVEYINLRPPFHKRLP
jgi:hypothetical protein